MKNMYIAIVALVFMGFTTSANAALMDYSYYTSDDQLLGYFTLDDDNLVVNDDLEYNNSIVEDLYFSWDTYEATYADLDLTGDIALGYDGVNSWVTGGNGDFTGDFGGPTGIWIAGTNFVYAFGTNFQDGYWVTTVSDVAEQVSEPATLALLGLGLMGIGLSRRKRRA